MRPKKKFPHKIKAFVIVTIAFGLLYAVGSKLCNPTDGEPAGCLNEGPSYQWPMDF